MNDPQQILPCLDSIPREVRCTQDYEDLARHFIPAPALAYIAGGCGRELTLAANLRAFDETRLWPRLLRPTVDGHTRLNLLGTQLTHPLLLAPVAYQTLVHPGGECETARGAAAMETPLVLSTLSGHSLEAVAAVTQGLRWFQLYFQARREVTVDLVRRAEMAGYAALVVTLDATIRSPGRRAQALGFEMPGNVLEANLINYPAAESLTVGRGESRIFQGVMRAAPTCEDLIWLLGQTRLPVIVKGVMHPDDACRLRDLGVAAQVVSNHGGRTTDGAPASLSVLPRVRTALGADYPLLFDGGIRAGADVFKALAHGANAVLIGRLQVYALAIAGALGVAHLLRTLREELEVCMAQTGCATLADIGPHMLFNSRQEDSSC
ncbi:MAG: alpha-hydroxy-acid oxidizing protein [Azonexus sp.]|nr:alpha-hydroxy-acid oxidizing protein [Azonexus sp.]